MSKLTHMETLKTQGEGAIVLIKGVVADGTPFYAYLKMSGEQFSNAKRVFEQEDAFIITDLGYVLHTEMKAEPEQFTIEHICDEFNL